MDSVKDEKKRIQHLAMLRLKSESCTISIFEFRIDPNNLDIE